MIGRPRIDLSRKVFGKLTVIRFASIHQNPGGSGRYFWHCQCECGNEVEVDGCCLRRGSAQHCGCVGAPTKHGLAEHYIYQLWLAIKQRCYNPKSKCFDRYGGRGITMCERWLESAANFYEDMGDRPTPQHTIERVDNDKGYEPGNCVWATRAEQNENTSQTRLLTFNGETMSVGKWARKLGIRRKTITGRLDRLGWPVERALSTRPRAIARRGSVAREVLLAQLAAAFIAGMFAGALMNTFTWRHKHSPEIVIQRPEEIAPGNQILPEPTRE